MIKVKQLENELMHSNCFIVFDDETKQCIVIDPGSKDSLGEIDFIETNGLVLGYIILTHEHTDHTWGVNALLDKYTNVKVIASEACALELPNAGDMYFKLYYDATNYHYEVRNVDILITKTEEVLTLGHINSLFIITPGHSSGSMSVLIGNYLFTGDTLMNHKIYVSKKTGSKQVLIESIEILKNRFKGKDIEVCPGHGEIFRI